MGLMLKITHDESGYEGLSLGVKLGVEKALADVFEIESNSYNWDIEINYMSGFDTPRNERSVSSLSVDRPNKTYHIGVSFYWNVMKIYGGLYNLSDEQIAYTFMIEFLYDMLCSELLYNFQVPVNTQLYQPINRKIVHMWSFIMLLLGRRYEDLLPGISYGSITLKDGENFPLSVPANL